jgi:hypothetical protein
MGDVNNHYEALDRSMKKLGIVLVDDLGLLRNGKAAQCVHLLRKLLVGTSIVVAKLLLQRGCPSHASDKKLVSAAFELVRDKVKFMPSLTVDQFFKEVTSHTLQFSVPSLNCFTANGCEQGFAAHKLAILVKLVGFIADYDKSFSRSTPPKIMYVVPTQVGADNLDDSAERDDSVTLEDNDASGLDDMNTPERAEHFLPPPPSSASRASVNSSTSEWPQTDFIKKHILDSKLKSAARIVPSPTATKSSSGGRATSASRGRSTTPNSTRKLRTQDEPPSLAPGIDIYDIEEKTAALEAIQALRAARKQSNSRVHATFATSDATATAPISTYNAEPPILPSPYQRNESTLSELAAADVTGDYPYLAAASGARSGPTYSSSSPRTASNGAFFGTPYVTSVGDAAPTAGAGAQNGSVGANNASLEPTGDFAAFVQLAVDAAVQEKLLNDSAVQQVRWDVTT